MVDLEKFWKQIRDLPNVCGYSRRLKPKIVGDKETEERSVRIYVERKIPEKYLFKRHVIPKEVGGVKTDVIEVGKLEAPPSGLEHVD